MKEFVIRPSITNREPIKQYLKDISKIPLLTPEEELKTARAAKQGDKKAFDRLVTANLRFVITVAKQYQNHGVNFEDLINEGNMGLIHAAELFDPEKGIRFLSYAVWWIRQSLSKAIYDQGRTIRIPISQIRNITALNKASKSFEQVNERPPTVSELSEITGMEESKICALMEYNDNNPLAIDSPFSDDEESGTLLDVTPNKNIENTDAKLMEESKSQEIDEILSLLGDRDHDILILYFGIGVNKMTTKDIARHFGISAERVRQVRDKAISRLRTVFKNDLNDILYG